LEAVSKGTASFCYGCQVIQAGRLPDKKAVSRACRQLAGHAGRLPDKKAVSRACRQVPGLSGNR